MRLRTFGVILVAVGLAGLIGTSWSLAETPSSDQTGIRGLFDAVDGRPNCNPPTLPGRTVVDVVLSDMGGGMMGGHMMNVVASPSAVAAGGVSLSVWNVGMMVHELIVLPLSPGAAGTRPVGAGGQVSEAGSRGEASKSCGEGAGGGIAPRSVSWVTVYLAAERYELICNLPGHYAMGMFTELDVR